MDVPITIDPTGAQRSTSVGSHTLLTTMPLDEFVGTVAQHHKYESGLLPPGVVSIRRQGPRSQYVLQTPPGLYNLIWGEFEGQSTASVYRVAMPYRVIFAEFNGAAFVGARMFYAMKRIDSYDDVLYHLNLPNVNCRGYNETSVGWVCLYQRDTSDCVTDAQRIAYVAMRCSGDEAYNDSNMEETDGTRFYEQFRPEYQYLYSPQLWEARSERYGWEWTLENPDQWIPVRVTSRDEQDHHDDDGELLTVGAVLFGKSSYYYSDTIEVSPFNDPDYIDTHGFNNILQSLHVNGTRTMLDQPSTKEIIHVPRRNTSLTGSAAVHPTSTEG